MADGQPQESAALVTGATAGIGRLISLHLARRGMRVAGFGRNPAALASLEADAADLSGEVLAVQADVRDVGELHSGFELAEARFGPVDLVVACAGVADALGPAVEVDAGAWWQAVTT